MVHKWGGLFLKVIRYTVVGLVGACALWVIAATVRELPYSFGTSAHAQGAAYICLETNSATIRQEMTQIIESSAARLADCEYHYDFRIVVEKEEFRHGEFMAEVQVSFDVYDRNDQNVTYFLTVSSGSYVRHSSEEQRVRNVGNEIRSLIRQNHEGYLELINGL